MEQIFDTFTQRLNEAHEKLLSEIAFNVLGRHATIEDFKDFTKYVQQGDNSGYWLGWKNMKLGRVNHPTFENNKFTFVPCSEDLAEEAVKNGKVTFKTE